jgi:hypothetical protein
VEVIGDDRLDRQARRTRDGDPAVEHRAREITSRDVEPDDEPTESSAGEALIPK